VFYVVNRINSLGLFEKLSLLLDTAYQLFIEKNPRNIFFRFLFGFHSSFFVYVFCITWIYLFIYFTTILLQAVA